MKTATEIHKENGSAIGSSEYRAFKVSDIEKITDEAVAHGMTIAAEIRVIAPINKLTESRRQAILTARDNKVWRKE